MFPLGTVCEDEPGADKLVRLSPIFSAIVVVLVVDVKMGVSSLQSFETGTKGTERDTLGMLENTFSIVVLPDSESGEVIGVWSPCVSL